MAKPAVIEPVRRSFAVLEALSRRRISTLSVLVEETGLPRPTVLASALGRAWLAFCPEEERRVILRDIGGLAARQEAALRLALDRIRRTGWAFTAPPRPTRLHGMAVPIRSGTRMLGSLSMRFTRSAMSEDEVGQRFGHRLAVLARAIASDVVERPPS